MSSSLADTDLASLYIEEIGRYPVMTAEEFDRLIPLAQSGDRDALNRIVQGNLRFVVQIAAEFAVAPLPFADLIAEGNTGMIKAVERFDRSLGYRFSTYAVWWVRNAIQRAVRKNTRAYRTPHNRLDDLGRIRRKTAALAQELGRNVLPEEAAGALGMSPRRSRLAIEAGRGPASIDEPLDDEGLSLHALMPDPSPLPDEQLHEREIAGKVHSALEDLGGREAEVIRLSFGLDDEPLSLAEVGARYGISKERVRQIRNRAMARLRDILCGKTLAEFCA